MRWWCIHNWGKWKDDKGNFVGRHGSIEVSIQVRTCSKCNKSVVRELQW